MFGGNIFGEMMQMSNMMMREMENHMATSMGATDDRMRIEDGRGRGTSKTGGDFMGLMSPEDMIGSRSMMEEMLRGVSHGGSQSLMMMGGSGGGSGFMMSSVQSFDASDPSKCYERSQTATFGPNGVMEAKERVVDGYKGVERVGMRRALQDQFIQMERARDMHSGEEDSRFKCSGVEENEAAMRGFNDRWMSAASHSLPGYAGRQAYIRAGAYEDAQPPYEANQSYSRGPTAAAPTRYNRPYALMGSTQQAAPRGVAEVRHQQAPLALAAAPHQATTTRPRTTSISGTSRPGVRYDAAQRAASHRPDTASYARSRTRPEGYMSSVGATRAPSHNPSHAYY